MYILSTPHPRSNCEPRHRPFILERQPCHPITAKHPTRSIRPLANSNVKQFHKDVVAFCPITPHFRAARFPPISLYLLHSCRTVYQRHFVSSCTSHQHLCWDYHALISYRFLCSSKAEGRKGARHFVPVIRNTSKQQVRMMLILTV